MRDWPPIDLEPWRISWSCSVHKTAPVKGFALKIAEPVAEWGPRAVHSMGDVFGWLFVFPAEMEM